MFLSTCKAYWISTKGAVAAVAQRVPQAVAQAVEPGLVVELVELLLVAVVEPFVDSLPSSATSRSKNPGSWLMKVNHGLI